MVHVVMRVNVDLSGWGEWWLPLLLLLLLL
jgi:hypothetical protein